MRTSQTITGAALALTYAQAPLLWACVKSGSLGRRDVQGLTLMESYVLVQESANELRNAWNDAKPIQRAAVIGYILNASIETARIHNYPKVK